MAQILSDIALISKPQPMTVETIEKILTTNYGELIRWAIVSADGDKLKICVTYKKGHN